LSSSSKVHRVAVYARCSTARDQSPEAQLRELKSYCEARGWHIAEEIVDHGYSGTTDKRPGFKRLMQLSRERKVDVVVTLKLDRLFRSLKNLVIILQELEELGILFISVVDQIDMTTASGRLMVHLLGAFAEFEAALIRERTLIGLDNAIAKGKRLGRPLSTNQSQIRELRSKGFSYRRIRKELGCSFGAITSALRAERKSGPEMA
jgi:DNA invertase Pin-like site-specific DNA recombinase